MRHVFFYSTDIGEIGIADNGSTITHIFFDKKKAPCDAELQETALIKETAVQLMEYFSGKRKVFDFPVTVEGTEFQKAVWNTLKGIPYGETRSYGEIAAGIGRPKACRAVGMANNKNPVAIVVPCHRVVGADGKLVGYAGGLGIKEKLLVLEKQNREKL